MKNQHAYARNIRFFFGTGTSCVLNIPNVEQLTSGIAAALTGDFKAYFDLLSLFELDDQKSKPIKELSSGNRMKVSVAASLIHNPKILILDEPFVHLDIKTTQTLIQIIRSFRGRKTVFITSHTLDLVSDLCDRFLIMDKGCIMAEETNKEGLSPNELKEKIKSLLTSENKLPNKIEWLN